jgi:hypothetical protein
MTNLTQLSPDEITTNGQQLQARYDAFKAKGLKLDLTRGGLSLCAGESRRIVLDTGSR